MSESRILEFDLAKPEQMCWFVRLISELQGNLVRYEVTQNGSWASIHIL